MKLGHMINRIDMFVDVIVYDCYGNMIAQYDGKNSIDVKYNNWEIIDFLIRTEQVKIWIEEPENNS